MIAWVASHPVIAPSLYLLIYAGMVLLSLPEAAVVTVAGGLLFGTLSGGILAVLGSSAGAIALFLAVRYQLADAVAARRGKFLDAIRQSLRRDGFSYLLAIRLVPAFPFWLVNLAAALSGMRLLPYRRGHGAGDHARHVHLCLHRCRPRRRAVGGWQARPRGDLLAAHPGAAGRARRAVAAAGRLAALEAFGCLSSTWR